MRRRDVGGRGVPFDLNTVRWGYPTTDNGFCLTPNATRGRSRGTVRLRTRDFRDRSRVDPRYFTDPDGHDMAVMTHGVRLARRIAEQPALKEWVARELAPGPEAVTDDELADYITKTHNTVYHPACTARMGPTATRTRWSTPSCGFAGSRDCAWPTRR
jgi:choline oxidase